MELLSIGVIGAFVVVGGGGYSTYNRLIALDERCNTAFADVDVQMKHRHSVIPMLVETVKGFANHESGILKAVTDARATALSAVGPEMRLEAEGQLGQTITSLITVAEQYPELAANSHFRELRIELTDIENRITASRRFYNLSVDEYNSTRRQFPGNMIGDFARLGRRSQYNLGAERILMDEPVSIKF